MSSWSKPDTFFLAGAIDGRLRLHGLPSSGPWEVGRLVYRTGRELDLSTWGGRWVVRTTHELDHALSVSDGVPAPITLYISYALLSHAYEKWEGSAL